MRECGRKYIVIVMIGIMVVTGFMNLFAEEPAVFECTLARQGWYQSDPIALKTELIGFLADAMTDFVQPSPPIAIVMPHAGYAYSGAIMATAMNQVRNFKYDRIIVIGPSHYVALPNQAAVLVADAVRTPLGSIYVDKKAVAILRAHPKMVDRPEVHPQEHSVQIEYPWIQVALPNTPIVPIVLGQMTRDEVAHFASILKEIITPATLVIISSDFTHFGSRFNYVPFNTNIPANIKRLDDAALDTIQNKDLWGFQSLIQATGATICGEMPIQLLLAILPNHSDVRIVGYASSGQLNGDWSNSVSYASVVVTGEWQDDSGLIFQERTKEDKKLLQFARKTIETVLKSGSSSNSLISIDPVLNQNRSVFVTLKKHGQLRGCVGSVFPTQPLVNEVQTQAVNAAINDQRFSPVTMSEMPNISIEITILSPIVRCDSIRDIRLGKHGIILKKGVAQALFLPQVAIEEGWDLATTLTYLAQKAGLSGDAWKQGTEFYTFEGVVISEER